MSAEPAAGEDKHDEFLHMTRAALMEFLSMRGLSTTGSKRVLISRAFAAWESGAPLKLTIDHLREKLSEEYRQTHSLFQNLSGRMALPVGLQ